MIGRGLAELLLVYCCVLVHGVKDPEHNDYVITHGHIREAIVAMQKSIVSIGEKLQRHEYRVSQTGDQTLKIVKTLDRSRTAWDRNFENLGNELVRMDRHLQTLEEKINQNSLEHNQRLDRIEHNLQLLMTPGQGGEPTIKRVGGDNEELNALLGSTISQLDIDLRIKMEMIENGLRDLNTEVSKKLTSTEDINKKIVETVEEDIDGLKDITESLVNTGGKLTSSLRTIETLLSRNDLGQPYPIGDVLVKGVDGDENAESLRSLLLEQKDRLEKLQYNQNSMMKKLSGKDIGLRKDCGNQTQEISGIKYDFFSALSANEKGIQDELSKISTQVQQSQKLMLKKLGEVNGVSELLYDSVDKKFEKIGKEMKSLSNVEKVVLDTADSVLSTKRRLEYGIQQILLEVSDIVKVAESELNTTLVEKVDDMKLTVLANHTKAFANMTSKIEDEIGQVWRQIGIMYQQLSHSQDLLSTVENQTKTYVNSSLNKVGKMGGQVGQVLDRMATVEDNLNYLLGRLSLVASEFNVMKVTVGQEMGKMREKFATVNKQLTGNEIQDDGRPRGPIPIPEGDLGKGKS